MFVCPCLTRCRGLWVFGAIWQESTGEVDKCLLCKKASHRMQKALWHRTVDSVLKRIHKAQIPAKYKPFLSSDPCYLPQQFWRARVRVDAAGSSLSSPLNQMEIV